MQGHPGRMYAIMRPSRARPLGVDIEVANNAPAGSDGMHAGVRLANTRRCEGDALCGATCKARPHRSSRACSREMR
jgi:hypothetical protein